MRTELDQVAMLQISDLFARTASPRIDDQPAILAALGNAFADHLHVKLVFEINGTDQEVEAFSTIRQQQYSVLFPELEILGWIVLGGKTCHMDEHVERLNRHHPFTRGVILKLEDSESLGVLRKDWAPAGYDLQGSVMSSIDQTAHLLTNNNTPSSTYLKERLASLRAAIVSTRIVTDVSNARCSHRSARKAYSIGAALVAGLDFVDVESLSLAGMVSNQVLLARVTRIMI